MPEKKKTGHESGMFSEKKSIKSAKKCVDSILYFLILDIFCQTHNAIIHVFQKKKNQMVIRAACFLKKY